MKRKMNILLGVSPEGVGLYKGETRQLQVFYRFRELSNWQLNPLWNGGEAPDYEASKLPPVEQELIDVMPGPYRVAFFMKTKSKKTKDVEIEISSWVVDDDNAIMAMNIYNSFFERMVQLLELEGPCSLHLTVFWISTFLLFSTVQIAKSLC